MELSQSILSSQCSNVLLDTNEYIRTETSKRYNALNLENIERVVLSSCKSTHDNYKCEGCCSHRFSKPQLAIDSVSRLRQKIWNNNFNSVMSSKSTGRDVKNSVVLGELLSYRYKYNKIYISCSL